MAGERARSASHRQVLRSKCNVRVGRVKHHISLQGESSIVPAHRGVLETGAKCRSGNDRISGGNTAQLGCANRGFHATEIFFGAIWSTAFRYAGGA